jgi:hypothetical protein
MELLAGYLKAMNYLQPWTKSTFDTHIGNLKIENIDEEVFPKKTLYKQALGLTIVNLNNIPQAFLSLVGADNKIYGPEKEKGVIGAILTPSEKGVKSEVVGTSEMAKAINILSEFYQLSRDFYKFDDLETKSNISKIVCDRDDPAPDANVNQFCLGDTKASARQKVHLLLTGLILFSTSKLMAPDGGFYSKLHTRNWKPMTEERYLEDQLEMQQALLNAGAVFKSDAILFRAVDNFFFLKKNFWNSKLGFFNKSEHTPQAVVRISQIIKARNTTSGLRDLVKGFVQQKPELESSVAQMSKMIGIWDRYLQDLVSENFEPIELLHDLRLQSVSSF